MTTKKRCKSRNVATFILALYSKYFSEHINITLIGSPGENQHSKVITVLMIEYSNFKKLDKYEKNTIGENIKTSRILQLDIIEFLFISMPFFLLDFLSLSHKFYIKSSFYLVRYDRGNLYLYLPLRGILPLHKVFSVTEQVNSVFEKHRIHITIQDHHGSRLNIFFNVSYSVENYVYLI